MSSLVLAVGAAVFVSVVDLTPPPENGVLRWPHLSAVSAPEPFTGPAAEAPMPTADGLAAVLDPLLDSSALDGDLSVSVRDGLTGDELYGRGSETALIPASSTKAATAAAVLATRGSAYRIPTRVVAGEDGRVVLVAGGDVTLTEDGDGFYHGAAELSDLAEQVLTALNGESPATLVVDTSVFAADDGVAPGVAAADVRDGYTAQVTPLMLDGGRVDKDGPDSPSARHGDPTRHAADTFAALIGAGEVVAGTAPDGATELGVVYSPTMQRLSEYAMLTSDNLLTDALARQAALATGEPGSFAGGAAATMRVLADLGLPVDGMVLKDGSGLSKDNRLSAGLLASLVSVAASGEHPELSGLAATMAVAGHSGSLWHRFDDDRAAHGEVRAKTGTLSKVSSLTGMVVDADGRWLTFAVIVNDRGNLFEAEAAIDAFATVLAECGCR
ncbi:D-alanyl-D-alanine carboxypeptidase/D-alanyl-D-alanine endopeptidase [Stackebrandtia albiflava]|uniref:D-alanyl-D-alanine carboxypeptidase/D-alanyl-D-alanine endopeptidase n=1 Tax=Stackebrandtia albiflava TaxID=406432 RepID=UPI001B86F636|nr:D-alanyl-D-alanine carboxypeptidase/D-alanyl-D-alanine-endopeptidase [Stackebrandtia albiflava]